jgi:hypothetical protein
MCRQKRDIDLSFLNGRELIQLCIGLYQTIFKFDEDVAISVEGGFRYFDGQDESIWRPGPGSSSRAARTAVLLGAKIENFESDASGTLSLTFSDGRRLTIIGSNNGYESYDITRPGQTIVV